MGRRFIAPDHDLAYIDALRGVAIIAVIVAHVSHQLPLNLLRPYTDLGNAGVQLFFAISAFTLMRSADLRGLSDRRSWAPFYVRRALRIAPMYWFGIALYAACAWAMAQCSIPERWSAYTLPNVAANAFLIHGLFPSANISIVHGGWSIATEVAFYALFPALFIALRRRTFGELLAAAGLALGALTALQIALLGPSGGVGAERAFWYSSIVNQLPVFLLGMAVYRASARVSSGGAGVVIAMALAAGVYWTPWARFVFPAAAGAAACVALVASSRRLNRLPWLEQIGKWSYSIYVVHFLFATYGIALIMRLAPSLSPLQQTLLLPPAFIVSAALSCCVASFTYQMIELPPIRAGSRLSGRYARTKNHQTLTVAPTPGAVSSATVKPPVVGDPDTVARVAPAAGEPLRTPVESRI